jgi:hypothetical protein
MPDAIRQAKSGRIVGLVGLGLRGAQQGPPERQVHDGDTVVVRAIGNFGVRLLALDAPEVSFRLPGGQQFVPIGDPAWETFLTDPFASTLPPFRPPLYQRLIANLMTRVGAGAATNHAKHAGAATAELLQEVKDDIAKLGKTNDTFEMFLSFANDIVDRYGRLLCYFNRDQADPNVPAPRPPTYNERLLTAGLVSPYFIWPNIDPFRKQKTLEQAVLPPGKANHVATTEPALSAARAAVAAARQAQVGLYEAADPLRLQPFELRFLARREPPDRWVVDLGKSDDVLIRPQNYWRISTVEDRLFIPPEYVPLFVEAGWKRER